MWPSKAPCDPATFKTSRTGPRGENTVQVYECLKLQRNGNVLWLACSCARTSKRISVTHLTSGPGTRLCPKHVNPSSHSSHCATQPYTFNLKNEAASKVLWLRFGQYFQRLLLTWLNSLPQILGFGEVGMTL